MNIYSNQGFKCFLVLLVFTLYCFNSGHLLAPDDQNSCSLPGLILEDYGLKPNVDPRASSITTEILPDSENCGQCYAVDLISSEDETYYSNYSYIVLNWLRSCALLARYLRFSSIIANFFYTGERDRLLVEKFARYSARDIFRMLGHNNPSVIKFIVLYERIMITLQQLIKNNILTLSTADYDLYPEKFTNIKGYVSLPLYMMSSVKNISSEIVNNLMHTFIQELLYLNNTFFTDWHRNIFILIQITEKYLYSCNFNYISRISL